jgi:hypothetical protein
VHFEWPGQLVADDICLEDEAGRRLFEARYAAAGFRILPLIFKGQLVFTGIRLVNFSLHLAQEAPGSPFNIQFLVDAFRQDTSQTSDIDLRIASVILRRGSIRYDLLSRLPATGKRFDPAHIDIQDLNANISLETLGPDSLNARIRRLSFSERSGFAPEKISLHIAGNSDSLAIRDFEIHLKESALIIPRAHILYADATTPGDILTAPLRLQIAPSELYPEELAAFVPELANFHDPVILAAQADGCVNDINLGELTLRYSDKMHFAGTMTLKGITRPGETYLVGKVNKMYLTSEGLAGLATNFNARPVRLPDPILRLGVLHFSGEISGFFDNLVAYGKLSSDIGTIETDLLFGSKKEENIAAYVRGTVTSSELLAGELSDDGLLGILRFDASIDAQCPVGGSFAGNVRARVNELDYRNYRYENILLSGHFQANGFDGFVRMDDPNGSLFAEGMFRSEGQKTVANFDASLQHLRPDNLNLYDKLDSPDISLSFHADFTGNTIDNLQGSISVDSLDIRTAPRNFFMKQFKVTASGLAPDRRLSIASDLVNGEISGAYSFASLFPGLFQTLANYLPALTNVANVANNPSNAHVYTMPENDFALLLAIENTEHLSQTLRLPLALTAQGRITGFYNQRLGKFRTEAFLPGLRIGNTKLESCYFTCENPSDRIDFRLRAAQLTDLTDAHNIIDWQAHARDNRIETLLHWTNNQQQRFEAHIGASARFSETDDDTADSRLRTDIHIAESPLLINDSLWTLSEADLIVRGKRIDVSNFMISLDDQRLYVDGTISDSPGDTLLLDLNRIELSYIFDALQLNALRFGGKATGLFHASDPYHNVILNGNLYVQDFSFNQVTLGDLNLFSSWDEQKKGIRMSGDIYENDTTRTDVTGYIYPAGEHDGLDLTFDAKRLNIAFLTPYLDNVVSGLRGRGSGYARLYGSFEDIDLEGRMFVRDGGLGIGFLDTYYTFSDSILLDPGTIRTNHITLYDSYGNTGIVNAQVNHSYFRNFTFDVDIQTNRMLVYNASEKQRPTIYGTVFSSGTSRIHGNERTIDFDVNMRTEPRTSVSFNFMGNSTATAYDFISFKDRNAPQDTVRHIPLPIPPPEEEGTELRMNFTLDVTADANLELIMNPLAGDRIKGYGNGSLQVEYGTKTDLRMYGIYSILSGDYNFSLQQLIRKDFKIREGSSVSFRGDPRDANLSINAIYNVTANIGDLDPTLLDESARTNIPVNCVLQLEGALPNPSLSFDLELPGANSDLERKVKSFANTEDMMTRQIVYLLVLNKFHPSDFTRLPSSNEFSAMTSAAISSQISSILSALTDKVQIGTNIRASQEGFSETEVEMLLSGQLWDNRLLFNGNFGYKNNPNVKNVFVGEFDIEYLLTPSGEFRLKAYNHANDMYRYLKQSLTTQGFGIMYKKDFSTLSDLFRRRRRSLFDAP